jgi:hypothetical protein
LTPDDEHVAARNMQRIEINIYEKKFFKLVIYQWRTERGSNPPPPNSEILAKSNWIAN